MALNRIVASMEDTLIASVAERAVQHHSGSFDQALEEALCAGFETIKAQENITATLAAAA